MNGSGVENRIARMAWVSGARPRPELVDAIIKHHQLSGSQPCSGAATLWGGIIGALLGVLLKGMALPESPWGPETGLPGIIIGALAVGGLATSLVIAGVAVFKRRDAPALLRFAALNLLMIFVVFVA